MSLAVKENFYQFENKTHIFSLRLTDTCRLKSALRYFFYPPPINSL